jgi:hypothetical protein
MLEKQLHLKLPVSLFTMRYAEKSLCSCCTVLRKDMSAIPLCLFGRNRIVLQHRVYQCFMISWRSLGTLFCAKRTNLKFFFTSSSLNVIVGEKGGDSLANLNLQFFRRANSLVISELKRLMPCTWLYIIYQFIKVIRAFIHSIISS